MVQRIIYYLSDLISHDKNEIDKLLINGIESGKMTLLNMSSMKEKARALLVKEGNK